MTAPGQTSITAPDPTATDRVSRREFLRRSALTVGLFLGGPLAACATSSAEGTLAEARQRGFIRVGFANEPPYGYVTEGGELTGKGPELARAVMRRLDVPEIDGVLTPFGSLISGLQDGQFDVIAAGMYITPDRCEEILFSDPDFCIEQAFLVARGNPHGIAVYEDIAVSPAVRVGTMTGAVEVDQAAHSGIAENQIVRFDSAADLLDGLRHGDIDAAALSTVSLANLAQTADLDDFEVTPPFAYAGELGCGAYGFRRRDRAFRDEFNRVLHEMRDNDSLRSIVTPFGFGDAADAAAGRTAAELCAP